MSELKCPMCGEILQKYGEVDPETGTSTVLGANCGKCGIGDSDIKLWQALIDSQERYKGLSAAFKKQLEVNEFLTDESNKFLNKLNNIRDLVKNWYGVVDDDMYTRLKKELDLDKYDSEDDEKCIWVACPKDDPDFIWTSGDTKNEVIDNLIKYDYDVEKYIIKKIKI